LLNLDPNLTPNFIIIKSPEQLLMIDSETELKSSIICIFTKILISKAGSMLKALLSLKANEIKEKDYVCGIMGGSHVGFGFFGSGIHHSNCLDDFFEKYFDLIGKNINKKITKGEPGNFYRVNQYNDSSIYSSIGGIIHIKTVKNARISGVLDVSGYSGGVTNDIILGSTSGGTIYIESEMIMIKGSLYLSGAKHSEAFGFGGSGKLILNSLDLRKENCLQNLKVSEENIFLNQEIILNQLKSAFISPFNSFLSKYHKNFEGVIFNVSDCPPGFDGPLCKPCQFGYFKPFYGSRGCVKCPCPIDFSEKKGICYLGCFL
jgi:hypothetical protein